LGEHDYKRLCSRASGFWKMTADVMWGVLWHFLRGNEPETVDGDTSSVKRFENKNEYEWWGSLFTEDHMRVQNLS
jgi:hypothetical protein